MSPDPHKLRRDRFTPLADQRELDRTARRDRLLRAFARDQALRRRNAVLLSLLVLQVAFIWVLSAVGAAVPW